MKVFMIFLTMTFFNIARADEIRLLITNYKKVVDMDYQIELIANQSTNNNQKLLLDCQSFINGLYFIKKNQNTWETDWFIMLSGNDCEEAFSFTRMTIDQKKKFCLVADSDDRIVNFYTDLSVCR